MTAARSAILEQLQQLPEPTTATALAAQLGRHANTIRDHLEALVERGLATRQAAPSIGRGRPSWLYSPAAPEPDGRVRHYTALALALATQLQRSSIDPLTDALAAGQTWGQSLVAGERAHNAAAARARTVEVLEQLGFDPHCDALGTTVRVLRCPLLDAAREQPEVVCTVHLGLVRGVLAELGSPHEASTIHPFAEAHACVLRLRGARHSTGSAHRNR